MNTRKWLSECHAWLDDPGSVQCQVRTEWQVPQGLNNPIAYPAQNWRIKPATITLNGVELPKPVLCDECKRFMFNIESSGIVHTFWFNTREDRDAVYAKLVEVLGA